MLSFMFIGGCLIQKKEIEDVIFIVVAFMDIIFTPLTIGVLCLYSTG